MYCPVCGAESIQGFNYCKRCGAGLSTPASPTEPKASMGKAMGLMLFLVSLVSIAGFIALFTTVYNLGERPNFDSKYLIAIMAFGGATVVGVVGLLVWLLLRLTGAHPQPTNIESTSKPIMREHLAPQLPAAPIAMPSVTEHTTRNFEPSSRMERSTRE